MTKQLKTIEILNPSKSATCSMWRYPESAKIFQHRGMDFDGFRVLRVKGSYNIGIWKHVHFNQLLLKKYVTKLTCGSSITERSHIFEKTTNF